MAADVAQREAMAAIGQAYELEEVTADIGAGFEPTPQLVGLNELMNSNLFYSPTLAALSSGNTGLYSNDIRRVVTEPIHLLAFINYFLSRDDELHARFRFIERKNEPIFYSDSNIKGHGVFIATPLDTRRIEFETGGSLLLFRKDKFTASVLIRSATALTTEPHFNYAQALSFEPTAKINASYSFGDLSDRFFPSIELLNIERPNRSYTYLNFEARYEVSHTFELKCRIENIFANPGDFWTGFDEYPRSIWLSGRLSF